MDDNFIIKVSRFSNKTEKRRRFIGFLGKISPYITFILYACFSVAVLKNFSLEKTGFFAVPAFAFLYVSVIRHALNRKRPFELYDIPKLIEHKNGESFPSRHSTCAAAIALAVFTVSRPWGIFAMVVSGVIAVTRVMCGVHFVKDVLAGLLAGILPWAVYFWLF